MGEPVKPYTEEEIGILRDIARKFQGEPSTLGIGSEIQDRLLDTVDALTARLAAAEKECAALREALEVAQRAATGGKEAGAALQDALVVILPMAKGYAAEHPVGRNDAMVRHAVDALERSWAVFPGNAAEARAAKGGDRA